MWKALVHPVCTMLGSSVGNLLRPFLCLTLGSVTNLDISLPVGFISALEQADMASEALIPFMQL